MPDKDGKLTEDDKSIVQVWVKKHGEGKDKLNPFCPICGSADWFVADHLVQPVTIGANHGLMLGGVGYPQVMLVSLPCGYTRFLNAVVLGLFPAGTPAVEPAKEEGKKG